MSKKKSRLSCSVPKCMVTGTRNPEKYFFSSPSDSKRRDLWLTRMRRDKTSISPNTKFFVCEDHFDLEHDLENYIKFKYSEGKGKYLLKNEVVPHIFECQTRESESRTPNQPNMSSQKSKDRPAALKIARKRLVNDSIASSSTWTDEENVENTVIEQSTQVPQCSQLKMSRNVHVQCNLRKKMKSRATQCTLLDDNSSYPYPECEVMVEEQSPMDDISFSTASATSKMPEYSQTSTDSALHEIAKKKQKK